VVVVVVVVVVLIVVVVVVYSYWCVIFLSELSSLVVHSQVIQHGTPLSFCHRETDVYLYMLHYNDKEEQVTHSHDMINATNVHTTPPPPPPPTPPIHTHTRTYTHTTTIQGGATKIW